MNPYDLFPFPSAPLPRTHPHALGGLVMLHGFAAPAGVRVLDIGCGAGRNLAWIAATSDCECLGVDLASTAIADAQEFANGLLGLERVEFRVQDFREVEGVYDVILANGLYSWVPAEVRADLLAFVDRHLSPDGVAFVSFHEDRDRPWRSQLLAIPELGARLRAARELSIADPEVEDGLLVHDHLADISDPVSVAEFQAALPPGLQYLCDARLDYDPDLATFHEAVLIRAGRQPDPTVADRIWWVTEESFPATVQGVDPTQTGIVEALSHSRPLVAEVMGRPVQVWEPARRLAAANVNPIMTYFGALVDLDPADLSLLSSLGDADPDTFVFFARAGLLVVEQKS